jgi:hypothetical protein
MRKTAIQLLIDWMEQNQYFIGNDLYAKQKELLEMEREQSSKNTKLREAAELVVDLWNDEDTEIDRPTFHFAMDILEKALK